MIGRPPTATAAPATGTSAAPPGGNVRRSLIDVTAASSVCDRVGSFAFTPPTGADFGAAPCAPDHGGAANAGTWPVMPTGTATASVAATNLTSRRRQAGRGR
ncbi:hypothetical protein [Planosporangium sp. 12N6]|uniref:hypothetical protein n=1 Tax=Planosporangium spinosum TaxID=3402278 RepID=UPI003CEDFD55